MPTGRLIRWYARAKRPMPWRSDPQPYVCWLSEIMLQQTTYDQALPYYTRFLARFPDVATLAAADEQDVLKAWEGLGYYARARNLHKAAQKIVADGRWPTSLDEWRAIPGVGPYTAAALASVLNGALAPVVDGNVARVFARYWLLADDFRKLPPREKLAARLKAELFAKLRRKERPGDLNQAMMELGALVCTPKNPACDSCPLRAECRAYEEGVQSDYPARTPRKPVPVRRMTGLVATDAQGRVLLVRRADGDLLKGLWELPALTPAGEHVQVFSHFKLDLSVQRAEAGGAFMDPSAVPLTTATRKVLARMGLLKAEA